MVGVLVGSGVFDGAGVEGAVSVGTSEGVSVTVDDGLGEGVGGSAATQAVRISKVVKIQIRFMWCSL